MKSFLGLDKAALSARMRAKRWRVFENLISDMQEPWKLLVIDGNPAEWAALGFADRDVEIVILNIKEVHSEWANIRNHVGDACDMSEFATDHFDLVYCNSVIEHVGDEVHQAAMAAEVRRVGKRHWIQTPNRNFPIEPHFTFPLFQFLPRAVRIKLIQRFDLGWYGSGDIDLERATEIIDEIQLLNRAQLASIFPTAYLLPERFGGLVKSWVAIDGFSPEQIEAAAGNGSRQSAPLHPTLDVTTPDPTDVVIAARQAAHSG